MPYTTTIDGTSKTKSGKVFDEKAKADVQTSVKNARASDLGIKPCYQTTECDETWLAEREAVLK